MMAMRSGKPDTQISKLTTAEQDVMRWLAQGHTNADIARLRGVSPATVRNQLHHIFGKLGAHTRGHAVALWLPTASSQDGDRAAAQEASRAATV